MKSTSFEAVTREMVHNLGKDIGEIKSQISNLDNKMTELFNHQSNRLPMWTTVIITILSSLVTGLIIMVVK